MKRRSCWFRWLAGICILTCLVPWAGAYEADVHLGLTYWLARKAGFCPAAATDIASGDQVADEGIYLPATWIVGVYILLRRNYPDRGAFNGVRENHFPAQYPKPGEPWRRTVEPAPHNPYLQGRMDGAVSGAPYDFGRVLHPFQDSWSHAGKPDTPFRPGAEVNREYAWSHPEARGGWYSHNADVACLHKDETIEMAHQTYLRLLAYAAGPYIAKHQDRLTGKPADWERDLLPRVKLFVQTCDKAQKLDWFMKDTNVPFRDYPDQQFIQKVNTPDSTEKLQRMLDKLRNNLSETKFHAPQTASAVTLFHLAKAIQTPTPLPFPSNPQKETSRSETPHPESASQLEKAVELFLNKWIVEKDIEGAMNFIDRHEITRQFEYTRLGGSGTEDWVRKFLTMWLLQDHGLVNSLGHGDAFSEGYAMLPSDPKAADAKEYFGVRFYRTLGDAIVMPGAARPYKIQKVCIKALRVHRQYAVMFNFKELDHDSILLVFAKQSGEWKVVRMVWSVL